MLHDLDLTLAKLLRDKVGLYPVEEYDIRLDRPTEPFSLQKAMTLNLFLFDVRENRELRSPEWRAETDANGHTIRKRPLVRLDCFYMITAWSKEAGASQEGVQAEHQLLARVLRTLYRYPTLPPDVLQGSLVGQQPPLPTLTASPDGVRSLGEFWTAVGAKLRPGIQLVVTMAVDPTLATDTFDPIAPVGSRTFMTGQTMLPGYRLQLQPPLPAAVAAATPMGRTAIAAQQPGAKTARSIWGSLAEVTVADGAQLKGNEWLMISDAARPDFFLMTEVGRSGPMTLRLDPPLRYEHARDAPIVKVKVGSGPVTSLSAPIGADGRKIPLADGTGLKAGDWLLLEDGPRSEFVRISQAGAGPGSLTLQAPYPRWGHAAGVRVLQATPSAASTTALAEPVGGASATLYLTAKAGLTAGTVLMIGTGSRVEFVTIKTVPNTAQTVTLTAPPTGNHAAGVPVRVVTPDGAAGARVRLAALPNAADLQVVADGKTGFSPGDLVWVGQSPRTYHQVAAVTPEAGGPAGGEEVMNVTGRVTDAAGTPVAGARVRVAEFGWVAVTDARGRYTVSNLPAGSYTLTVTAEGFAPDQSFVIQVPGNLPDAYTISLAL
jgi:hypothetical protein